MAEPEFNCQEQMVIAAVEKHIVAFAKENPDRLFSQFAFDCNPDYGSLLLCLDTYENSIAFARENEEDRTRRRNLDLSYDDAEYALNTLEHAGGFPVVPYNTSCGDFEYQGFADIELEGWIQYRFGDSYPGNLAKSGEDTLQAKAGIFLSRVADRLVDRDVFSCLNRTTPFLVSIAFHDGTHFIVRIQNWPKFGS